MKRITPEHKILQGSGVIRENGRPDHPIVNNEVIVVFRRQRLLNNGEITKRRFVIEFCYGNGTKDRFPL